MFSHAQCIQTVILTFLITQVFFFHNDVVLSPRQIYVGDVEKQVSGPNFVSQHHLNHPLLLIHHKFNLDKLKFRQGKFQENLEFWKIEICASGFVPDITENRYKIPFRETPPPFLSKIDHLHLNIANLLKRQFKNYLTTSVLKNSVSHQVLLVFYMLLINLPANYASFQTYLV